MKCIFNIGKNISILAKVTQVSDVAHGPLVFLLLEMCLHLQGDVTFCVDFVSIS
jgi:hypothetical protein